MRTIIVLNLKINFNIFDQNIQGGVHAYVNILAFFEKH